MSEFASFIKWAALLFVAAGVVLVSFFVMLLYVVAWALHVCVAITPPW